MQLRLTLIIAFCLAQFMGQCQSPADWWYFGAQAGIHFTPSGPVADTNGILNTGEGVATISDNSGDLLFYTDGTYVFNSIHDTMPNGIGLLGDGSSTQSAIIVPKPGDDTKYYIITVMELAYPEGMRYTLVDMTLDGGLGDVDSTEKNVLMVTPTCEKVAAVQHSNGVDIWVVTHEYGNDVFDAFLITNSGINLNPIVSNAGNIITGGIVNTLGYLRFSPSGTKLAAANHSQFNYELFDFDPSSGLVSNGIEISTSIYAYGIEFAPSEDLIYTAGWNSGSIMQYEITSGIDTVIENSEIEVGLSSSSSIGALQLGVDRKIYVSRVGGYYLGVIELPNESGLACSYVDDGVDLEFRMGIAGLPTFVSSFFSVSFVSDNACIGDTSYFVLDTIGLDSVSWNFGDPASGAQNFSSQLFPSHVFSDTGIFSVTLIAYSDTLVDTTMSNVFIYPRQTLDLGPDTLLCEGDILELNIQQDYSTYLWSDGSATDSMLVDSSAIVSVRLFGFCDTLQDTIIIRFDMPVPIDLGPDTTFCEGSTIELDADVTVEAEYQWNTGDTSDHIIVSKSGLYIFEAANGCGEFNDSISVTIIPLPDTVLLPADTINCFDAQIILERPVNDSITYFWSDSTSKLRFEIDSTQQVWLAAFNDCGFSVDTMNILFNGEIKTELGEDTNICDLDSIQLSGSDSTATYFWSTGDTTISIYTEVGLDENYIVTIFKGECAKVKSRRVRSSDIFCPSIDCSLEYDNVFSPNGDGINDLFRITSDCDVYSFDMTIYNRWGQLVHYSQNVAYGWDGFVNGEPAAEGVYYFVVEYKDFVLVDADRQLTRGSFTLTR